MFANMAKRSRYFIVSPGKFDKPEETGGQIEFGYRYFEAAAPGTIMIGMRAANNKEFDKIFNWEDAVIEVPFTSDAIVDTIRELDKAAGKADEESAKRTSFNACFIMTGCIGGKRYSAWWECSRCPCFRAENGD